MAEAGAQCKDSVNTSGGDARNLPITQTNSFKVIEGGEKEMTKSLRKKLQSLLMNDDKAQVGALYAVFFAAIIILAIIIIFTFIPGIGTTVEQSTPRTPAYCTIQTNASTCANSTVSGGSWNASDTYNPNAAALRTASGSSVWTSTSGMLKVAIIIGIVVIILSSLFGIFQARKQQGGGGGM